MTLIFTTNTVLLIGVICFVVAFADIIPKMIAAVIFLALGALVIALCAEVPAVAIFTTFIAVSLGLLFYLPAERAP